MLNQFGSLLFYSIVLFYVFLNFYMLFNFHFARGSGCKVL